MSHRTASLALAAALAASGANAQGVPVIDSSSIAQLIAQLEEQVADADRQLEQIRLMSEQLTTATQQLQQLTAQVNAITGGRGLSALLNGDIERAAREAMVSNLNEAMREAGAGNFGYFSTSGRFALTATPESVAADLLNSVLLDPSRLQEMSQSESGRDRGTSALAGSGTVLSLAAQDAYGRAAETNDRLETLAEAIDEQPDIKASMDLNTRTTIELGFLLNDMLRMEAAAANTLATGAIIDARDREADAKISVTDLPTTEE